MYTRGVKTSSADQHAGPSQAQLERRLGDVGRAVRSSLIEVLTPIGGAQARPTDVCREFGVNKSVASRLIKGLGTPDPGAALGVLPGPEALRGLMNGADDGDPETARRANAAIDDLERFLRLETGGRDGLTAVLSESVPELRDRFELGHKQAAHRAMANLMGVSAEVYALTLLVWPNADDPLRLDALNIHALHGLRLRRPGCTLSQTSRFFTPEDAGEPIRTLDARTPSDASDFIVRELTTLPSDRVSVDSFDEHQTLTFDVGPLQSEGHAMTLATLQRKAHFTTPRHEGRSSGIGLTVDVPTRLGVVEILWATDAWDGRTARAVTHLLSSRGAVDPNDASRDSELLRVTERAEPIAWEGARVAELPDHPGTLEFACRSLGIDARRLRGYRIRSAYPVVGTQLSLDLAPR